MLSHGIAPFAHAAVQGMELPHGGPAYGQVPVDQSFASQAEAHMFRTGSDVAGASSARVESRAKARERARERVKEKHHTGRDPLERDAAPARYAPSSGAHPYASLPSQVSSALQHPFQAPFHATGVNQRQTSFHHASSFNLPETFSSSSYAHGYQAPQAYAPPEPSPSSLPSVSHYFVENPPGAMGGRYGNTTNPNFPGFAPGPPAASSLRGASSFSNLLNESQYSGFPSQSYYPVASPYSSSQTRPPSSSSSLGQPPGSRLSHQAGTVYPPPPSSQFVRPGPGRQNPSLHSSSTPHSLDPDFYNPQIPTRLPGFEELEEEFKP